MTKITVAEEIIIENIPSQQLKKLKDILWVTNDDYTKKVRLGLWIGNEPKNLYMYVENQEQFIITYGMLDTVIRMLKNDNIPYTLDYTHKTIPVEFLSKSSLNLRDYQKDAVNELLQYNNGILISPAGSGKTRMAMALIGKLKVKTLWLTHTLDLLKQSKRVFKQFYEGKVGEISGGKIDIGDITFATVQTLHNVDIGKLKDEFSLIVIDEVHRVGGTPTRLSMFYKVLSNLNAKYKYGITATLYPKNNNSSMIPIFLLGNVRHEVLQSKVPTIPATHKSIFLSTPINDVFLNPDQTINYNELVNYLIYNQARNNEIFNVLMENKERHNIVLTTRNDHIKILSDMLNYHNIENRVLIGEEKSKTREIILKDFQDGKYKFLLSNYQLAKEGLDLPIADTMHYVMPMRDKKTIIQSKGRVERPYDNKTKAIVYDYVDKNIGMLWNMYKERKRYI